MNKLTIKIVGPAGFGIKASGLVLAKYFKRLGFAVFAYTEYPSLIRGGHNSYQMDLASQIHPERRRAERGGADGSRGNSRDIQICSASEKCDILIALTKEAIERELRENKVRDEVVIIYDQEILLKPLKERGIGFVPAPLIELAKKFGSDLMKNTVAIGVLIGFLELPFDKLNEILKQEFGKNGKVVEENVVAARAGYGWVKKIGNKDTKIQRYKKNIFSTFKFENFSKDHDEEVLITGNQACALGCIASNCPIYVAYPMTPATEILHYLKAKQKETGMIVHQPEDEIAGIHVALGASFAGVRAATGTSGGGFALMNEGLSLAGMLELPIVIFEVQRPAPATGNPTWTEQGDLLYAINSGHGEFPRIILAPGNPEECFILTQKAFNLADKFQIPVIILSDKFLGESAFKVDKDIFDKIDKIDRGKLITKKTESTIQLCSVQAKTQKTPELFMRYKIEKNGVSWRTIPGLGGGEHAVSSVEHNEAGVRSGEYIANSDEHNKLSYSNETSEVRIKMMDKRMGKLEEIRKEIPLPRVYGPKNADVTLVCWGSQLGPCIDAMSEYQVYPNSRPLLSFPPRIKVRGKLQRESRIQYSVHLHLDPRFRGDDRNSKRANSASINLIHFSYMWPLPKNLDKFLSKFKKLILIENNKTGQLGKLIRQETGIEIKEKILKYNSRPFWPEEISDKIHRLCQTLK